MREALPELEEFWFETYGRVARTGEAQRFESRVASLSRWFDVYAFRVGEPDAHRVALLFSDISARKRHEQHTQLLLREVNHRAKNLLSLVQAIAKQTASTTSDDFIGGFQRRIQALAANQDLLVKGEWTSVPILDLLRSQLAHFDARVGLSGPPLAVNAQAAQTLTLALHELATNAAKYGALSTMEGKVDVAWEIRTETCGRRRFALSWTERGGPLVRTPKTRGFGSTVIEKATGASFECEPVLQFAADGVQWSLECAAHRVLAESGLSSVARSAPPAPPRERQSPRVLVVEDEPLIALEIADALATAGLAVIGPAFSLREGLALMAECDLALLDVNLGGETSEPIAEALARAGRPFIVVSGYERDQQPKGLRKAPRVPKPILADALIAEVRRSLAS
jgi:two-component sensor histidine kinase/CheY-like chemotaxis protein